MRDMRLRSASGKSAGAEAPVSRRHSRREVRLDALRRVAEARDRRLNGAIRRAGVHEPRHRRCEQAGYDVRIGPAVQLLERVEAQRGDCDSAVTKLRQRDSKCRSTCAREEARAEDQLLGLGD
jgi:hypothetical protein